MVELARAIPHRRTHRRPFHPTAVSSVVRASLRRAARSEHATLVTVDDPEQRVALRNLLWQAHGHQRDDPAYRAEFEAWTGHSGDRTDGVPAKLAGPRPEPPDVWVLRDYAGGAAQRRVPGKDFEPDPLIAVLCSFTDHPLHQLYAGQAMQRVLVTATASGLAASFLAQPVEVPTQRRALRALLGDRCWPQIVLRIGYGSAGPAGPRRPLDELLIG